MHLRAFLKGIEVIATTGDLEREIEGIACDSRHVERNFAFVCYQGVNVDGHEYISNAIDSGATAIISELPLRPSASLRERKLSVPEGVSLVQVKDGRLALAIMAANWYDIPAERLKIIGITGTNGKTSTAHLIQSVFTAAGCKMGIVGSIGHKVGNQFIPATTTTPDALHLHKLFRDMVDDGEDSVVMEVTSHSLEQKRVAGIQFDVAVFTNLTQDHLDFHSDMQDYLDAKVKLFQQLKSNNSMAILNVDDDASNYVRERTNASILTYGIEKPADLRATNVESTINRLSFTAITPEGNINVQLKLLGEYNLYNALAAIGVGLSQGFALDVIKSGLESATVPGRFELVDFRFLRNNYRGQDFAVVVDYAHTPDALERLLKAARKITKGQLICVFGCGGDRDRGKRPIMGRIASEIADHVVITSDNPRTEEPEQIAAEIEVGIKESASYDVIISRDAAIARGIEIARNGDIVVIAGKGHENYQIFKDKRIHFDDREVATKHLWGKG